VEEAHPASSKKWTQNITGKRKIGIHLCNLCIWTQNQTILKLNGCFSFARLVNDVFWLPQVKRLKLTIMLELLISSSTRVYPLVTECCSKMMMCTKNLI